MNWRRVLTAAAVCAVVAAVVLAVRWGGGLAEVRAAVVGGGPWGPLLFVLLSAAITVGPVPRTVFTVAAGVLFGSVLGVGLALAGTTLAAVVAYWLVRAAGGGIVERWAHLGALQWLRARLDRSGMLAMASLRLIPALPFSVINYAAALAGVRFWPYLGGTVLGILPGTVAVVVLGDAATGGRPHPALLVVSLVCAAVGIAGAVLSARPPKAAVEPVRSSD